MSIAVPPRWFRNELRAIKMVWHRDMIRFVRDKPRIVTALLQPMLYLFVLGSGLSSAVPRASAWAAPRSARSGPGRSCSFDRAD